MKYPSAPRFARLLPLCALVLWGIFACKGMPEAEINEDDQTAYGDEDFGGYDYEGWDLDGEDEDPSLTLPPGFPSDALDGDLLEPFPENGEAFLPDTPPEAAAIALAEPLPEPDPPDLPDAESGEPLPPALSEEPSPEGSSDGALPPEESSDLAGEEPPSEGPAPEEASPAPALPPPPPRIVRPSTPIPPPPPAREIIPMPPVPLPDPPARNPPVLPEAPSESSSRIARALAGQTVEVPFRGTGWVYLGEAASKRGMEYASRRLDSEGQTFLFRAVEAGVYELQFYRQDFIRDYIINDLVTVIVEEPPPEWSAPTRPIPERGTVTVAPRWPALAGHTPPERAPGAPSGPAAESGPGAGTTGPGATVPGTVPGAGSGPGAGTTGPGITVPGTPSGPAAGSGLGAGTTGPGVGYGPGAGTPGPGVTVPGTPSGVGSGPGAGTTGPGATGPGAPSGTMSGEASSGEVEPSLLPRDTAAEEYVRRAREEYQEERFSQSMAVLDQFLERFPRGSDEAYWLYAQICEKQGPSRDIRRALYYYRRLVAEYPQSSRYNDARRRIAYLERYYINIQ